MRGSRRFEFAVLLVIAVVGALVAVAQVHAAVPISSVRWTREYAPSDGEDEWRGSAVGRDGSLIVAGTSRAYTQGADIVVACYERDGGRRWLRRVALAGAQETRAVALGRRGEVFVAASRTASGASDRDILLVRLSPRGKVLWKAYYRRSGREEYPIGLGLDSSGNAYVAGTRGTETRREDFLLVKFSPAGKPLWKTSWDGGASVDWCRAMRVTGRGTTYLTGQAAGTEVFVPLVCVRASGQIAWVRTVPLASNGVEEGRALAVRGSTVVVAAAVTTMAHDREAWVAAYDTAGDLRWAQGWWHTGDGAWPNAVAVDANGGVAVAGFVEHPEGGSLPLRRGFLVRRAADGGLLSAAFSPAVASASTTPVSFWDMELAPDGSAYCAGSSGGDAVVAEFSATGGLVRSGIVGGDDRASEFRDVSVARVTDGVTLVYAGGWTHAAGDTDALAARFRP